MSGPDNIATPILLAVLGAGRSSRFGANKLAAVCAGKPLGRWALEAALGTGLPVVWIAGDAAPGFIGDTEVVLNLRAAEGIGTSVALAARIAVERGATALLVALADMPLVGGTLLRRLVETGAPAACLHPDGRPGVPALLPASTFGALMAVSGDQGAGRIIAGLASLSILKCNGGVLLDVDTPQALAAAELALTTKIPNTSSS